MNPLTIDDITDYYSVDTVEKLEDRHIYEAMCEKIVEKNPSYAIENLTEDWLYTVDGERTRVDFVQQKLDAVLTPEVDNIISDEQKQMWVEATCTGIYETKEDILFDEE